MKLHEDSYLKINWSDMYDMWYIGWVPSLSSSKLSTIIMKSNDYDLRYRVGLKLSRQSDIWEEMNHA